MPDPVDSLVDSLMESMTALIEVLRLHDEPFWAKWMSDDMRAVDRGDARALDHILAAYGGMGSVNDLILDRISGRILTGDERVAANENLRALLSRVYDLARSLRREV
ncbi:hypothetical protein CELL_02037 [Cellulomonas sp. T2.31MG-18]|uniref:DUF6966 domain-containing protein n=1 Tax=Cellulomonas sp. T2.31MG-18 TaxID=3157619 RepID=UPI0035EA7F07